MGFVKHHAMATTIVLGATVAAIGSFRADSQITAERVCPGGGSPAADVVFCEGFDGDSWQASWNVGSNRGRLRDREFVLCTDGAFGFGDACAAWSGRLLFDGEWGFYGYDARRPFEPQSELYIRWYQAVSGRYGWGALEDKSVMVHDPAETMTAYVGSSRDHRGSVAASGPGVPFVANYQDLDWPETKGESTRVNRFQNKGNHITLEPGKWYLLEWYIKLNRPGVSDGVTRLWIDDATQPITRQTLRMEHADMRWLRSEHAGRRLGVLRLTVYHQRCDGPRNTCPPNGPFTLDQYHRWDQIVVSRKPIGPVERPQLPE